MGLRNRRTGDISEGDTGGEGDGRSGGRGGADGRGGSGGAGGRGGSGGAGGTIAQLRNPPGGRDARIMLGALFLDRTGSGTWSSAAVLYFTIVAGLSAGQIGVLLGAAGLVGIAGSPIAGRLAERFPVRSILVTCHAVRVVTLCAVPFCHGFAALLAVTTVTTLGDRASKTMEILFATQVAGAERATYRALSRVVMNAAFALGAGLAAIAVAVGTRGAYDALVVGDGLSYIAVAAMVLRTTRRAPHHGAVPSPKAVEPRRWRNPWRDPGYLLFVVLDIFLNLDDAVLMVGLPLWAVTHTDAPHAVVPGVLVINTLMVVFLQMPASSRVVGTRPAARAVAWYGVALLGACALIAVSGSGGAAFAGVTLVLAAVVVTIAELVRSLASWELAVSLAPGEAQASYMGVAGMAQAIERSAGPVALSSGVMAAGPVGWLGLGVVVTGLGVVQRVASLRRLDAMGGSPEPGLTVLSASPS
ncbi:MFS transporter [Catenulispora subtropica]|uniref:MFS transporter n=1 Tax=Catenulispora subtropica TaxID=450798 RepID=A0ABN2TE54_9ACTN